MTAIPVFRPTARIIVLDPDDRVLLFSFDDPRGPKGWFTPGGGLRKGETPQACAARELAEETGFTIAQEDDAGPVVATRGGLWRSEEGTLFFGADWFYCVRVPEAVVDTGSQEAFERSLITGHHWWTVDEMLGTTDPVTPIGLADLVAQLLDSGVPELPVQLPWHYLDLADRRRSPGPTPTRDRQRHEADTDTGPTPTRDRRRQRTDGVTGPTPVVLYPEAGLYP